MLKSVPVWGLLGVISTHVLSTVILSSYLPLYLASIFGLPTEQVSH